MSERRKGPTLFWEFFWKHIYGERRSGVERRATRAEHIVFKSCAGGCNQGRAPCDCRPSKENDE